MITNRFGSVGRDRVTFNLRKGWFAGAIHADYPTKHITSVALDVSRRPILGVLVALVGFWAIFSGPGGGMILFGLVLLLLAVYLLWGRPAINFATAGGERIVTLGQWPWQKAEAATFVEALKSEMFKTEK